MEDRSPFGPPAPPQLRTLQIIAAALIMGVATLAIIAIAMPAPGGGGGAGGGGGRGGASIGTLRLAAIGLLATAVPMAFVLRHAMLKDATGDDAFPRFSTATIISCALMEGTALFAVVIFLIGRNPTDLAIATAPLALMVLAFFPTEGRWRRIAADRP